MAVLASQLEHQALFNLLPLHCRVISSGSGPGVSRFVPVPFESRVSFSCGPLVLLVINPASFQNQLRCSLPGARFQDRGA